MNSVYRWIYEHTGLCRTLLFVGLFAFAFYASTLEYVSFLSIYLLVLAVWFLVGRFIASAPAKLFKEPLEQFYRSCDPYPLIEEAQRQLARKNDDPNRQMVEINNLHHSSVLITGSIHKNTHICLRYHKFTMLCFFFRC